MEDEILKIMAAEIAGENVTKEEREKMNRWWEEKRGNERTYKMLMGELGEVVRLVRQQGGLDKMCIRDSFGTFVYDPFGCLWHRG